MYPSGLPTCSFLLRKYYLYESVRLLIVEGRIVLSVSIVVVKIRTEKSKIANKKKAIQVKMVKLV